MSRTVKKMPTAEQASAMKIEQCADKESGYDGPPLTVQPIKADHHMSDLPATGIQPVETVPAGEASALVKGAAIRTLLTPHNPDQEGRRRLATSLDLTTQAGRHLAYRAATSEDHKAATVIGQSFPIVHWLQHDLEMPDPDTGEIRKCVRTVLIAEDGTRISCCSDAVIGSLMSMEAFYGRPPWTPALPVSICQARSRHGRTYSYLDVH